MPGLGTLINVVAIVTGGLLGFAGGKVISERLQDGLCKASGVCVLFIGIAGAMQGMLSLDGGQLVSGKSLFVVASIIVGTLIGEIINLDALVTRFGEWLKRKTASFGEIEFPEGTQALLAIVMRFLGLATSWRRTWMAGFTSLRSRRGWPTQTLHWWWLPSKDERFRLRLARRRAR